ncbi:MAG: CDP-glycerol glycerophosphotransferase family protein [Clostridia bacterium]
MKKKVNLVNIKIIEKKAYIEILYKTNKEHGKIKAYLKSSKRKYYFNIKTYSFSQEIDYIKLTISLNINTIDKFKFVLKEDNIVYDEVIFLDNKDEKINELDIPYKIFINSYVMTINDKEGSFNITKRKLLDKFKYELLKTIKAKKKYHKWYILNFFKTKEKYYLLNDRIMYGDDNAEQLFNYINLNDKKMKKYTYFVLDKNSPNFKEIKKIGKVLKYGSFLHKIKYINCKMVISSHASYYDRVFNPFNKQEMTVYKDVINKQFVFLQHGVIMNDVHNILNREHIIADLFITTTQDEYEDVKKNYMYDEEEIVCTGLARFDKLQDERKKIILIAPTWRAFLSDVDYTNDGGNSLENSEFYQKYQSLLNRKDLINIVKEYEYKIQFLLHPASEQYKKSFLNLQKENVDILSTKDIRYSTLFKECSMFITDYSSTHFDVAFLQKPIIYYQFDQDKFFNSHYNKGYFDYGKDGFGELIEEEENLVNKIIFYIKNNCEIEKKYKDIIKNTFHYLDYNNAQRILVEIKKLSNKNEKNYRFNSVH